MEQPTELNNQILHKECNDFTKAMIYQNLIKMVGLLPVDGIW